MCEKQEEKIKQLEEEKLNLVIKNANLYNLILEYEIKFNQSHEFLKNILTNKNDL
jgi:hypothetical protein